MVAKKAPTSTPAGLEIDSLFEQELRVQNEDLRRQAALRTFYKLHPNNRVTVEQFISSVKQNKDIWSAVSTLGVLDFAEAVQRDPEELAQERHPGRADGQQGRLEPQ